MTEPGLTLINGRFYPHSFRLDDLQTFHEFVLTFARTVTLHEAYTGGPEVRALVIRHDVDHSGAHAVRFARWEAERRIRSSYYVLPTAEYYPAEGIDCARQIQALGHEVGVHNDALTRTGDHDAAIRLLADWAAELREPGIQVKG